MKRLYVLVALIIAILLAIPSQQLSAQPAGAPGSVSIATPEESLTRDATQYAQRFNVSSDEARNRLVQQRAIGTLNAAMTERETSVFEGCGLSINPRIESFC